MHDVTALRTDGIEDLLRRHPDVRAEAAACGVPEVCGACEPPSLRRPRLRGMKEPLAELVAYACPWYQVPDADLVRLTAAARATGHRWDAIEAACDNGPGKDIPAVIRQQYWFTPLAGPGLFGATQHAARTLTGRDAGYYPPLTWPCPGCGQLITDLRTADLRRVRPRGGLRAAGTRPGRRRGSAAGLAAPARPALRRIGRPSAAALAGRADHR